MKRFERSIDIPFFYMQLYTYKLYNLSWSVTGCHVVTAAGTGYRQSACYLLRS